MNSLAWCWLLLVSSATAQVPSDGLEDATEILSLSRDQVARLTVPLATGLTLIVPQGEIVDTVVLGNPNGFSASVDAGGTTVAIRLLRPDARGTLSVATLGHAYYFELTGGAGGAAAIQLASSETAAPVDLAQPDQPAPEIVATYKLSGDRALRPVQVTDDGQRTTIEWGDDQALPAVFGVGPTGAEEVVDWHMRDGMTVLDRVWPELVFRMDEQRARARRRPVQ